MDQLHNGFSTELEEFNFQSGPGDSDQVRKCKQQLDKAQTEVGTVFDYNLYDECYDFILGSSDSDSDVSKLTVGNSTDHLKSYTGVSSWRDPVFPSGFPMRSRKLNNFKRNLADSDSRDRRRSRKSSRPSMDGFPCGGIPAVHVYTTHPAVRQALHIPHDANFFETDNAKGFPYLGDEPDLRSFYKPLIETPAKEGVDLSKNGDFRVLIYNGDADPGLNTFVAQGWIKTLNFTEEEEWRPWVWDRDGGEKMGGYVTRYGKSGPKSESDTISAEEKFKGVRFDFATIRGAGHMVPQFKPQAAFMLLQRFVENRELPRLKKFEIGGSDSPKSRKMDDNIDSDRSTKTGNYGSDDNHIDNSAIDVFV